VINHLQELGPRVRHEPVILPKMNAESVTINSVSSSFDMPQNATCPKDNARSPPIALK